MTPDLFRNDRADCALVSRKVIPVAAGMGAGPETGAGVRNSFGNSNPN
jgi:hypothetical protein